MNWYYVDGKAAPLLIKLLSDPSVSGILRQSGIETTPVVGFDEKSGKSTSKVVLKSSTLTKEAITEMLTVFFQTKAHKPKDLLPIVELKEHIPSKKR